MAAAKQKVAAAKLIKYVGERTTNFGRPLWEIVLNLKNLGVGRFVIRHTWSQRYPEPTFYKILDVKPRRIEFPENMKGDLWAEVTFRGRLLPEPLNLGKIAWKDDFQIVHKHDEGSLLLGKPIKDKPVHILPRTAPLPPLWKEIFRRDKILAGLPVGPDDFEPEPELNLIYIARMESLIQVAAEGQEPTLKTGPGNFDTRNCPLYDDVIWHREEAIAKYSNLKPIPPTKGHSKFQLPDPDLA